MADNDDPPPEQPGHQNPAPGTANDTMSAVKDTARHAVGVVSAEMTSTLKGFAAAAAVSETIVKVRGEEFVRALCSVVEDSALMNARVAAAQTLGKMGRDAKSAYQTLYQASRRP